MDDAILVEAMPTELLELEVCRSAAQLAADQARWLRMVAELDRREAWWQWECRSMAHWLSWKCALSLRAGREHVRVARALEQLPVVAAGFDAGILSYSKVRSLTRLVMMPELETELVELAKTATASQLDEITSGYLRVQKYAGRDRNEVNHAKRRLSTRVDDHGMGTLTLQVPAEVLSKIIAVVDLISKEPAEAGVTMSQRRADAAVRIFAAVAEPDETLPTGATIVIRSESEVLDNRSAAPRVKGIAISHAAYERLRCSATIAYERFRDDGSIERTRTTDAIPRRVRRAVTNRDCGQCRWPGCDSRYRVEVHHVEWRSQGGSHDLTNLASLCEVHHHAVHDRHWTISGNANQTLTFTAPQGHIATEAQPEIRIDRQWQSAHLLRQRGREITPKTIATATHERCDLKWVVGTICDNEASHQRRRDN